MLLPDIVKKVQVGSPRWWECQGHVRSSGWDEAEDSEEQEDQWAHHGGPVGCSAHHGDVSWSGDSQQLRDRRQRQWPAQSAEHVTFSAVATAERRDPAPTQLSPRPDVSGGVYCPRGSEGNPLT